MEVETLRWSDGELFLLDQTRLPNEVKYVKCVCADDVVAAIKSLVVRGAPAIGVAAAYGVALEARRLAKLGDDSNFEISFDAACSRLIESRPTAVNLSWAVNRMTSILNKSEEPSPNKVSDAMATEAVLIHQQDLECNKRIGRNGAKFVPKSAKILTHCNAGALATSGYGTALGIIRAAWAIDKGISVFADETRPLLQGARLTAWELLQEGIPTCIITDGMSGHLMAHNEIDLVIVGADRVAANGDVANKIGTYMVAVLAARHNVPFYVACPSSTIDMATQTGNEIVVEERSAAEVFGFGKEVWAPKNVQAKNPAFDITPAELITAIVTEIGVIHNPSASSMRDHFRTDQK